MDFGLVTDFLSLSVPPATLVSLCSNRSCNASRSSTACKWSRIRSSAGNRVGSWPWCCHRHRIRFSRPWHGAFRNWHHPCDHNAPRNTHNRGTRRHVFTTTEFEPTRALSPMLIGQGSLRPHPPRRSCRAWVTFCFSQLVHPASRHDTACSHRRFQRSRRSLQPCHGQ